jgi:hypothetical protein
MKFFFQAFQTNLGSVGTAMALDISECFLGDAKKTKRYICRNGTRNVLVRKLNLHLLLVRELLTEGFHSCNQT